MKKRIGNDITFTWHIYRKDGDTQVPESFTGKDVEVKLISPLQRTVTIEDVSIATGVVTFSFKGKHQVTLGNYVAVLLENKGEDGMVTLDVVNAVTLVPHSYMEEDGDEGDVIEAEAVELTSTISAGGGGGIEQQQADWAQTDTAAVDYIKNKPDLDLYCRKDADNTHSDSSDTYVKRVYHEQGALIQLDRLTVGGDSIKFYHSHRGEETKELSLQLDDVEKIKRTATSELDGLMSAEDKQKLTDIEAVIPEQASSSNKLVDEDSMNSAIATATATFRGAYNLVTDLHLSVSATHAQIATALATTVQTADNNDYCYVQIPTADVTPTEIARIDRYKYDGTAWAYEYSLNNSGFTAAQWAALNSGITSGLVAKLSALPTNEELTQALGGKANTSDLAEVATTGSYNDLSDKPTIPTVPTNVSAFTNDAGYLTQHQDITGKADKVSNATNGNFAALDSNGNLTDSGHKHSDYLTQHQDLSNYVQKSQTAGLLKNDGTVDTTQYLSQHQDISGKADKSEMSVVPGTGADADKTTITLKQGTSATVLTAHQDVSVKEDKMLVVQVASGTSGITATVNTYYEVAGEVGTLAITLPTPTDLTNVSMVVIHLTAGTTPNVVIGSTATVDYSAAYDISAGSEYEINCLFNGDKWIVADMEVV